MDTFIVEGNIMKAKPKHFTPRPSGVGSIGQHPVIVLTNPNAQGFVLVTMMSHKHPKGTPTRSASRYGLPVDPVKGESRVSVGIPQLIHKDHLKPNKPNARMTLKNYKSLKTDIYKHITHLATYF